ncbi:MAG: hypothetical protein OXU29_05920 [Gammaproteobacteria bacterium]|nr:hypothetical protein [Gammaproteobacteria bacterium]MDD9851153.1 hypothetical protein [Gammaproteobacteria bacterium]
MNTNNWQSELDRVLNKWDGKYIVTSPDVDGLISAAILKSAFNAEICGIYSTRYLFILDGYDRDSCKQALWVDHDISDPDIQCLGQHLVLHSPGNTLPLRNPDSFNPNIFFPQYFTGSFHGVRGVKKDKYPFATCHFLLHLATPPEEFSDEEISLLAHADGSFANVHRYRQNCDIWFGLMFQSSKPMRAICGGKYLDGDNYHQAHSMLVRRLIEAGINKRSSQTSQRAIPRRWEALIGHQSIPFRKGQDSDIFIRKVNNVVRVIADISRFDAGKLGHVKEILAGEVETPYPDFLNKANFDSFMVEKKIFSHAFVSNRQLRYTTDLF